MGGKQSHQHKDIELKMGHPRFEHAKIITKNNERFLSTTITADEKEYYKWKEQFKKLNGKHEALLMPVNEEFERSGLCGSAGVVNLQFEDYPYLLTQQIYSRKGKKSRFTQQQLWHLLYTLVVAKLTTKEDGSIVGDIRPQNVFLNVDGKIKVATVNSWPMETTAQQKAFDHNVVYIAPEDMKKLELSLMDANDSDSSQMFSIGLTMLCASLLTDFDSLYDMKHFKFNQQELNNKLKEFKVSQTYSQVYCSTVSNLCSVQPNARMTLDQVCNLLGKHKDKIVSRQNFLIDNAPNKLHQEVSALRSLLSSIITMPVTNSSPPINDYFSGKNYYEGHPQYRQSQSPYQGIQAARQANSLQ